MVEPREYRGKRIDNGEWIEGIPYAEYMICGMTTAYYDDEVPMSEYREFDYVEIDPSTVGQFVGKTDKDKDKIYEGDYLGDWCKDINGNEVMGHYGVVTYYAEECRWVLADETGEWNDWTYEDCAMPENWGNLYKLGTIHDATVEGVAE